MTNSDKTPDFGPARISLDWAGGGYTIDARDAARYLDKQDLMDLAPAKRFIKKAFQFGHATAKTLNGDRITASVQW